jgi:uncharacterized protein
MLIIEIKKQLMQALKAKDESRLTVFRMLSSALDYEKIAKQRDLSAEEELQVVKREAKKREDAIEAYKKAQESLIGAEKQKATDRLKKETGELSILKEFLPEEISEQQIEIVIEEAIAETNAKSIADMGKVMKTVMEKTKGAADGRKVSEIVRAKLT